MYWSFSCKEDWTTLDHNLPIKWNSWIRYSVVQLYNFSPCMSIKVFWTWFQPKTLSNKNPVRCHIFAQAAGPDPFPCNATNRQNQQILQNCSNFIWLKKKNYYAILIPPEIENFIKFVLTVNFITQSTISNRLGLGLLKTLGYWSRHEF